MSSEIETNTLSKLAQVLEARKQANPDESYVASLYAKGLNKALEKVGEEGTEFILAAKEFEINDDLANQQALISETADLWFHSLVVLATLNIDYNDVLNELENRFGLSGLEEKASRHS